MTSLGKVLTKKIGQLQEKSLNDVDNLLSNMSGINTETMRTNRKLIEKLKSMQTMDSNLPEKEY